MLTKIRPYVFTVFDYNLTATCARDVDGEPCPWQGCWDAVHGVAAEDVWTELREHSTTHADLGI